MPTVLITGAARGLGLEFARQYAADGWDVIATVRQANPELQAIANRIEPLDMADFAAVTALGARIAEPLDLLIANAGLIGPLGAASPSDGDEWAELLKVNSIAPVLLVQALLPRLAEAKGKAVAISSKMGSIDDAGAGYIPYRSSKTALNMAWHVLALEQVSTGVAMAVLNPGWVQTDMGGPSATLKPSDSVAGMREVIAGLTIERTGHFIDHDGSDIAW